MKKKNLLNIIVLYFWRSVAAVHPGGAGTPWTAWELWQDPLESHEVSGGGECGEIHFQIYSTSDWTLMSSHARSKYSRSRPVSSNNNRVEVCHLKKFSSRCSCSWIVSLPSSGNPVFLRFAVDYFTMVLLVFRDLSSILQLWFTTWTHFSHLYTRVGAVFDTRLTLGTCSVVIRSSLIEAHIYLGFLRR